jgi:hypothetical protein
MSPLLKAPCMLCGHILALHFDSRGRKLDCVQVKPLDKTLAHARKRIAEYQRYVKRLETVTHGS